MAGNFMPRWSRLLLHGSRPVRGWRLAIADSFRLKPLLWKSASLADLDMQITVSCVDWSQIESRKSPALVVEELLDDPDAFLKELPSKIWPSDSATQHFETAEQIEALIESTRGADKSRLQEVAKLISTGDSIDEAGLSAETDGCYFASLSPAKIAAVLPAFNGLEPATLAGLDDDAREWIAQWKDALGYAQHNGLGLLAHCG